MKNKLNVVPKNRSILDYAFSATSTLPKVLQTREEMMMTTVVGEATFIEHVLFDRQYSVLYMNNHTESLNKSYEMGYLIVLVL